MTVTPVADNTQVAAGQMYPEDSNNEFTVMTFIIRQKIAELETATPVQIVAVHPGAGTPPVAGTVDVQLLVSLLDGNGNAQQQGIVYGLPYFRLQGGPWAVVCDPAINDFGFIVGCHRDISGVIKSPGISNPGSYRSYSFQDGIYVGGAFNKNPAATLWLKNDGTFVLTTQDGVVLKSDGAGNLDATCGTLAVTGNITATGGITAGQGTGDQVTLQHHTHTANGQPPTPGT